MAESEERNGKYILVVVVVGGKGSEREGGKEGEPQKDSTKGARDKRQEES